MNRTTRIPIEHVVVTSNQRYQQVIDALEARLGTRENQEAIVQLLLAPNTSWEQITRTVEEHSGSSGFTLFSKVDHGLLLSRRGKNSRATQYTLGNPLLALQMTSHLPETGLYAPLRLIVYEDEEGRTFVAYDSFSSQMAQYGNEEILRVAQMVEQKLEALVVAVTTVG